VSSAEAPEAEAAIRRMAQDWGLPNKMSNSSIGAVVDILALATVLGAREK
jgi:hypothetical protein